MSGKTLEKVEDVLKAWEEWNKKDEQEHPKEKVRLPLQFPSVEKEVNFFALRALLDFGRGYEDLFIADNGRGYGDCAVFGVMHMYISGKAMDGEFLKSLGPMSIGEHFGFKTIHSEEEVMGGVFKMVDGPLKPYADQLCAVAHQTGEELKVLGKENLGEYITEKVRDQSVTSTKELIDLLESNFQGFRDPGFSRKAVFLVKELYERYHDDKGSVFQPIFKDIAELPVMLDSDLLTALRNAGLLTVEEGVEPLLEETRTLGKEICADLVEKLGTTPQKLDAFMRTQYLQDRKNYLKLTGTIHF